MKIISMSVWGNRLMYWEGALANAQLYRSIYPGWRFRVYTDTENAFTRLMERYGCEVRVMENLGGYHGAFWRFLPASEDGVEAVIFRDADSRLNQREAAAVAAWLKSGKSAHIMRDHPLHSDWAILAGMWGIRGGVFPDLETRIANWGRWGKYSEDQHFLKSVVWPRIRHDCLQHVNGNSRWGGGPFPPHSASDSDYVGQIYCRGGKKRTVVGEYGANPQSTSQVSNQLVSGQGTENSISPEELCSACIRMLTDNGDEACVAQVLVDEVDWTQFAFIEEALRHKRERRLDDAATSFRKALDRNPNDAYVLADISKVEFQRGYPATALEFVTRAINLMPRNAILLSDCGVILRHLGRLDDALANCDRALAIAPNDTTTLNCRANILSALFRFDEALASYDRALIIEKNNSGIRRNRRMLLHLTGRKGFARASFDRARSLTRRIMRKCFSFVASS